MSADPGSIANDDSLRDAFSGSVCRLADCMRTGHDETSRCYVNIRPNLHPRITPRNQCFLTDPGSITD
jgi:hypothetical protein